jgi:hypothetical protein
MEFDFSCTNCRREIPVANLDEHFLRCFPPIEIKDDARPIRKRQVIIVDDEPIAEQKQAKNSQPIEKKKKNVPEIAECPICYEGMGNKRMCRKTSCGHDFHTKCLSSALQVKRQCPMCRANLTDMKIRIPKNTQPIPVSDRIPEVSHEIEVQRTLQELRQLEFVNLLSQNLRQITQSASRTNAQSASRTNAQSASISSNQSQGRRSWSVFIEQSLFVD